jgi:catalase
MEKSKKVLTTSSGMPIDNNQFSQTAGPKGPVLLQDFALIDKLAKFDRYAQQQLRHLLNQIE